MKQNNIWLCLIAIVSASIGVCGQSSQSSPPPMFKADDEIVSDLRPNGASSEMPRVIVWVTKDALTDDEIKEFATLLNQGITDIEKCLGTAFASEHYKTKKIEVFVSPKVGIAHSYFEGKPYIFFPPIRVRNKKAPYLHEVTHVLWKETSSAWWMFEGFANYVETNVSLNYGGYRANVQNPENKPIHVLAKSLISTDEGKAVLPVIGVNGFAEDWKGEQAKIGQRIYEDRRITAPAFYNLATSFVTFLAEHIGLPKVIDSYRAKDTLAVIHENTGKTVDEWKTIWLETISR